MAYTEVVEQYDRDLTPSEERLYQDFTYNKQALAFMTAAEVAAQVGVHDLRAPQSLATVSIKCGARLTIHPQIEIRPGQHKIVDSQHSFHYTL
jgi:hypothetical protein